MGIHDCAGRRQRHCRRRSRRPTLANCQFKYFYGTNLFQRCRFTDTYFQGFRNGHFETRDCAFERCRIHDFEQGDIDCRETRIDACAFTSGYWGKPGRLSFKDCTIVTAGKDPFISSAIYTIDRFDFNGCTIEGPNALVYISDQRPQPTDNLPATIALRGCTWKGTAPHAVTKTKEPPSAKKLILVDEKNTWPKASALIGAECRTPRANRSTG